jgi:hypothetical protein
MLRHILPAGCVAVAFVIPMWPASASAAVDEYGLKLANGSATSLVLNDTTRGWGYRFTAEESLTVDRALTNLTFVAGSPTLQVAIQADDGFGNPDGVDLSVGSITASGAGYQTVNMTPVGLTAGSVYHMIHRTPNGDGSNLLGLRTTGPGNVESQVSTGVPELNYGLMLSNDGGASWSLASTTDTVTYGLYNSTTNQAVGQPYAFANYHLIGQDIWRGQSFTYTGWGPGNVVDAVSMKIYKGSASVADDLRVYLVDTTTNASLWSDVLVSKEAPVTSGTGDIVTVPVPDVPLVEGRKYVLAIESIGSTAGDYQMLYNITDAPSPLFGENFQEAYGSQVVVSFNTSFPSGGFTDTDPGDARNDAFFVIHTTVPEPAAALSALAVSGALALGRRRSRR